MLKYNLLILTPEI